MNQRERLSPDSPTSKVGICPRCGLVELKVDDKGYIICSKCLDPHSITTLHSFT